MSDQAIKTKVVTASLDKMNVWRVESEGKESWKDLGDSRPILEDKDGEIRSKGYKVRERFFMPISVLVLFYERDDSSYIPKNWE